MSHELGHSNMYDLDYKPVFCGSAFMGGSVQPCKIALHLHPCVRVAYGGMEHEHHGRFDFLKITDDMEWVSAYDGRIPSGRRPVDGGCEENGDRLYHALIHMPDHFNFHIPAKTGEHLRGAHAPFGGKELVLHNNYKILCWAENHEHSRQGQEQLKPEEAEHHHSFFHHRKD
ncbi:hypothetical protein RQP46_003988 [Phenoliferia psychrophenolica]